MNTILKAVALMWLVFTALVVMISVAVLGFWLLFTNYKFMYDVMPFVWGTSAFILIRSIIIVIKSNPIEYLEKVMFGESKI